MSESIYKNNELENEVCSNMSYFWYSDVMIILTCKMCLAGSSQHWMALWRTLFDGALSKPIVSLSFPTPFLIKILIDLLQVQVKPTMIYWKFCKKFGWMILSQHPMVLMMQILIKLPKI